MIKGNQIMNEDPIWDSLTIHSRFVVFYLSCKSVTLTSIKIEENDFHKFLGFSLQSKTFGFNRE